MGMFGIFGLIHQAFRYEMVLSSIERLGPGCSASRKWSRRSPMRWSSSWHASTFLRGRAIALPDRAAGRAGLRD